ncbi:MAG: hypothetical protein AAGH15_17250 [Myxococcota bacterium]
MAEHYNNVTMSEQSAKNVARDDAFWTGPKLIVLCAVTLGAALFLLWAMSVNLIGPTIHE